MRLRVIAIIVALHAYICLGTVQALKTSSLNISYTFSRTGYAMMDSCASTIFLDRAIVVSTGAQAWHATTVMTMQRHNGTLRTSILLWRTSASTHAPSISTCAVFAVIGSFEHHLFLLCILCSGFAKHDCDEVLFELQLLDYSQYFRCFT